MTPTPASPPGRHDAAAALATQPQPRPWRRLILALVVVTLGGWINTPHALAGAPAHDVAPARATTTFACPPEAQAPTGAQMLTALRNASDRGFLWRITRDGHSSYLYGTIHVGRQAWLALGPTLDRVLPETDVLALELDPTDPELIRRMGVPPEQATANPGDAGAGGAQAPDPGQARRQQRLQHQIDAACIAPARIEPLHPVLQAMALASLVARHDGLDPAFGLELILADRAHRQRRPIVSLETPELQLAALLPGDAAGAAAMVDELLTQLETGQLRRTLVRLAASWEAGRLDDLANYEEWCDCVSTPDDRAQLKRLNDDRNPGLAAAIDALHRQGRRVLAAVGALHMTGPQGLPGLMAAKGYRVERAPYPK